MQFAVRSLALAAAAVALTATAQAQTFTFTVNQAQSNFTFSGTSTLGPISGNPSNMFQLLGPQNVNLVLQAGAQPFASLGLSGGAVTTNGPLHGKIGSPIPLATIDVNGLVLSATAPSAAVTAGGNFTISATLTATAGQLVVTPLFGSPSTSDLAGSASNPTNVSGTITLTGNAFRLSGSVNSTFQFSDPGSGQSGTITLVGTLVAEYALVKSFCAGDGSGAACPCGNNSPAGAGRGCLHSGGVGALLAATGVSSISNDTVVLNGSGMPATATGLFFQGATQQSGGAGAGFGDGLRCAGGSVVRLATKTAVGGASSFPAGGDPALHVRGGVSTPGSVRTYQLWYRNAATFCTASTFNLTNGMQVTWIH